MPGKDKVKRRRRKTISKPSMGKLVDKLIIKKDDQAGAKQSDNITVSPDDLFDEILSKWLG
jgi:hypothetical protein